jgi:glycosyltransferase involved in cell wall biosynthesis
MSKKKFLKLSIIIPCFNEKKTIEKILNKILLSLKTNNLHDYEIIIVDDCSKDGSREILKSKLEN